MKIDLSGKAALVTGSTAASAMPSPGPGGDGADVIVNGRSQAKVDAAALA